MLADPPPSVYRLVCPLCGGGVGGGRFLERTAKCPHWGDGAPLTRNPAGEEVILTAPTEGGCGDEM